MMKEGTSTSDESPSRLIDARIKELDDWRGQTLAHLRALIKAAEPEVVEEWKWRGVPVWYRDGMICTGETYKQVVKLTFARNTSGPVKIVLAKSDLKKLAPLKKFVATVKLSIAAPKGATKDAVVRFTASPV